MALCVFDSTGACTLPGCNRKAPLGVDLAQHKQQCHSAPVPKLLPKRKGLGTFVASLLSKLGIKKKKGCGCHKREAALNRFGWRISDMVKRPLSFFSCLILGHPKDRRRKKLLQQQQNPSLPSQEKMDRVAAKELRRQALLAKQNLA